MLKRIFSLFLSLFIFMTSMAVFAASESEFIALSESFENYPENAKNIGENIKLQSGVDSRVVSESEKNKSLYLKAWRQGAKMKADFTLPKDATDVVFSAKIKVTGSQVGAKLFSVAGGGSVTFLSCTPGNRLTLPDGMPIGGLSYNKWTEYTVMVDIASGLYNVYINGKCVTRNLYLTTSLTSAMNEITWSIGEPEDGSSEFYIDDIRIYTGTKLPSEMKFPEVPFSNEILNFVPTPEVEKELRLISNLTFDYSSKGASLALSGGKLEHKLLEDGNGVIHFFADENTNSRSVMNVSCPELAQYNKYVVSCDVWINKMTGSSKFVVFDGRGADLQWNVGADLTASGTVRSRQTGNATLCAYPMSQNPVNIAFAYNIGEATYDVYINGELRTKDASCVDVGAVSFNFEVYNTKGNTIDVYFDNFKAYNSETPMSDDKLQEILAPKVDASGREGSVMNVDKGVEAALGDAYVFMITADYMFKDGKKQKYPEDNTKPFVQNGTFMISSDMVEDVVGYKVSFDEKSGDINIGNAAILKLGVKDFKVGSKVYTAPEAPTLKDGTLFLPFKALMTYGFNKSVLYDERGMIILSDTPFLYTDGDYILDEFDMADDIWRYMQFDNPLGKDMLSDLEKNTGNQHPRVLLTKDQVNYILDRVSSGDAQWKAAYDRAISIADETIKTAPISATPKDADKKVVIANYGNKMRDCALAYMLTGDEKYAKYAIENLVAAASWDSLAETLSQLNIGDWAYGTGIGLDSFYYYLQRTADGRAIYQKAKDASRKLLLNGLIGAYRGTGEGGSNHRWVKMVDNFTPLIAGGVMCLTVALSDEADMKADCAYLLENVYKNFQIPIGIFSPDGAWYESVAYGAYGLNLMSYGLVALKNSCGSIYGLDSATGFKAIPDWYMYLGTPNADFNFHDMKVKHEDSNRPYSIAWLCEDALRMEAFHRHQQMTASPLDLFSLMYYELTTKDTDVKAQLDNLPLDHYFRKAEAGGFISSFETKNPTFVGFHGGWTGLYHDSLDVGEFYFEADGIVWAYDIGSDSYSMDNYFVIPEGYKHYRKNPQGENVILINPKVQQDRYYGQEVGTFAPLTVYESAQKGAKAAYDLTSIYQRDVNSYSRGYLFGDDRNTLTVRDEINLKSPSELYWFMQTPANIEIVDNKTAILTKDGKKCRVEVVSSNASYVLKKMETKLLPGSPGVEFEAFGESHTNINKLAIYFENAPAGELDITVKLLPQTNRYDYTPVDGKTKIADWVLPQGKIEKLVTLTSISADGKPLEDFLPDTFDYTVTLPFGTDTPPQISAESAEGNVSITQAQSVNDTSVITVSAEGRRTVTYRVQYSVSSSREIKITENIQDVKPKLGVPGKLINPISATGSSIPEPKNGPDHLIDGDFGTRYAIGDTCWFEVDLGEVTDISGAAVSFYEGSKRFAYYDLLYSEDGINYLRVFSGQSTGETEEYESLSIAGKAKYIRLIGYGNSTSVFNSVTELKAFK